MNDLDDRAVADDYRSVAVDDPDDHTVADDHRSVVLAEPDDGFVVDRRRSVVFAAHSDVRRGVVELDPRRQTAFLVEQFFSFPTGADDTMIQIL